ncbi:MAG TPA: hypothetical protein VD927_12150 [Chryseosolibacter sp.]|nr:hypothetical protein [Chryseosolibacter sp.]
MKLHSSGFYVVLLMFIFSACASRQSVDEPVATYPNHVGDHSFDQNLDDPAFKVCNESRVFQYYNFGKGMQYKGEKTAINSAFSNIIFDSTDSGYITIRFIVNCKGETGWFRIQQMDFDFQEKTFSSTSVSKILEITKRLDGWKVNHFDDVPYDYYQYLTFKLHNGNLVEIMP